MIVSTDLETRQIAIYSLIWAIYGVIIPTTNMQEGDPCTHTLVLTKYRLIIRIN